MKIMRDYSMAVTGAATRKLVREREINSKKKKTTTPIVYTYTFMMSASQRNRTFDAVRSSLENVWR